MLTDIQIAQSCKMKPINQIASDLDILEEELEFYGKYKAKLSFDLWERVCKNQDGKLILVTAINPTPAGEGKNHYHNWYWPGNEQNGTQSNYCFKRTLFRTCNGN